MVMPKLLIVALLSFAIVLQQHVAKPETLPPASSLSLAVSVKSPKHIYSIKDRLQLEAQLKNVGNRDLYLFDDVCWNPANSLNVHVFNLAGEEVFGKSNFLRDCLPPPPRPNDMHRFHLLKPGQSYTDSESFSISELVPKPGKYGLSVNYHSAISRKWISEYGGANLASLLVWTAEEPLLKSNVLRITVRE